MESVSIAKKLCDKYGFDVKAFYIERAQEMAVRVLVLSDIHGNADAFKARRSSGVAI
jgi:hypothetical protein